MLVVFSPIFVADTKITFLYNFVASLIKSKVQIKTRNATRCNKCHDLLHFENFNISRGLYKTQSNICDGAFIAKIVGC